MTGEERIAGENGACTPRFGSLSRKGGRSGLVRRKLEASQEHIALSILSNPPLGTERDDSPLLEGPERGASEGSRTRSAGGESEEDSRV